MPESGAHLNEVPRELRLRFTTRVEVALARVALAGPGGTPVQLGELQAVPDSASLLVAPIQGALAAGVYTVQWQVAGADGHPVRGEYSFTISPGAEGLAAQMVPGAPVETPPSTHHDPTSLPTSSGFDAGSPLYVLIRWLTFVGLVGAIGAVAFRSLVLPLARRRSQLASEPLLDALSRRTARWGVWMTAAVGVAALVRLYAQSYALHGGEDVWNSSAVIPLVTQTTWGWGWLLQLAGTVVALVGFALAIRGRAHGWVAAIAGVLALSVSPALSGHAAASQDLAFAAVVADALHVLGAGGWLGSLLLLVVVGIPVVMGLDREMRGRTLAGLVNAFSPTALLFAGMVVVTGLFATWLHVGSLEGLWRSGYGRTLLLKLAVLAVVFATGAYNWLRVKPALGSVEAAARLRRSAALELAVGVLVLGITAALVAISPPAETETADRSGGDPAVHTRL